MKHVSPLEYNVYIVIKLIVKNDKLWKKYICKKHTVLFTSYIYIVNFGVLITNFKWHDIFFFLLLFSLFFSKMSFAELAHSFRIRCRTEMSDIKFSIKGKVCGVMSILS